MLGFDFLYNLPQEVKAAKQSLCPLTPSLCSYIKQGSTLAENVHSAVSFSLILFPYKTTSWHAISPSTSLLHMHVLSVTKHSDLYLM